jgi:hypothetical protein
MRGCRASCLHRRFVEDYRLAVEAQLGRVEAAAYGYAEEEAAYYRDVEPRLLFKDWLVHGRSKGMGKAEETDKGLREAAEWLVARGYPVDWGWSAPPPAELWEAIIDVYHEDADGSLHGNELTRESVREWLEMELPPGTSQAIALRSAELGGDGVAG